MVKTLKVIDNLRDQVDVSKVCDDERTIWMGKEAVGGMARSTVATGHDSKKKKRDVGCTYCF